MNHEPTYELIGKDIIPHEPLPTTTASNTLVNGIEMDADKMQEVVEMFKSKMSKKFAVTSEEDKERLDALMSKLFNKQAELEKAKAEAEAKAKPLDTTKDAWWTTIKGEKLKISDMKTSHLFNSLRLVYNKMMPEAMRMDVKEVAGYTMNYPTDEGKFFLRVLFYQIGLRDNLTDEQFDKLKIMAANVRKYL